MKKNNTKIIISVFCFILLGLTACTSNPKGIEGKYVSIYDESTYLIFNKDGSLINSLWGTIENGKSIPQDCFRYSIDENNIITDIDACTLCCACVKLCPNGARIFDTPFTKFLYENFSERKNPEFYF